MMRHDDPTVQAAYDRWNDAILVQADHRIDCVSGCSIFGDVCPTGLGNAAAEQMTWRAYYDVRVAVGVEVAIR